jgi:hypothetical protein
MSEIALGVTVFMRHDKLEKLLRSINPEIISHVYISDDGNMTEEKRHIYKKEYPFQLTVFDLEYDAGLGYGRNKIVQELEEEYLLIVDSDMEMPNNVTTLKHQLEHSPEFGGICGMLLENNRIYTSCSDIHIDGKKIIKDINEQKQIRFSAESPLIQFDFISNAALFRKECLEDYSWDPNYTIGREHIDFYVGHYVNTDWRFGLCPEVYFPHHPGGSSEYLSNRFDNSKYDEAESYFLNKWGFSKFVPRDTTWIDTYNHEYGTKPPFTLNTRIRARYRNEGLSSVINVGIDRVLEKISHK